MWSIILRMQATRNLGGRIAPVSGERLGGSPNPTPARWIFGCALAMAVSMSATGCGSDSPNATRRGDVGGTAATNLAPPSEGSVIPARPAAADCRTPVSAPPGEVAVAEFDDARVRGTSGEARWPAAEGDALAVVPLADDAVVLERQTESHLASGGTVPGTFEYTKAQLRLRRLRRDGSTVWTTDLGVVAPWYLEGAGRLLVADGDTVRVLWPRFDGPLPAQLDGVVPATAVLSSVRVDGTPQDQVDVRPLSQPADRPRYTMPWRMSLAPSGSVTLGVIGASTFAIENFDPKGVRRWSDELSSTDGVESIVLDGGDLVYGASGGRLVSWGRDGARRWAIDLVPDSMAGVADVSGEREGAPAVALSFHSPQPWLCAIDAEGHARLSGSLGSMGPPSIAGAWWGTRGLMTFVESITLGSSHELLTMDETGTITRNIAMASSSDVLGVPGSFVNDVAVSKGELWMVGTRLDYAAGKKPSSETLENWTSLIRLAAPAGDGDLANVPVRNR